MVLCHIYLRGRRHALYEINRSKDVKQYVKNPICEGVSQNWNKVVIKVIDNNHKT